MKKKLIAVLLTLCMVLGMLPMTALAVWVDKTTEKGITNVKAVDSAASSFDLDGTTYYAKTTDLNAETGEVDYFDNYTLTGTKKGTLTWTPGGNDGGDDGDDVIIGDSGINSGEFTEETVDVEEGATEATGAVLEKVEQAIKDAATAAIEAARTGGTKKGSKITLTNAKTDQGFSMDLDLTADEIEELEEADIPLLFDFEDCDVSLPSKAFGLAKGSTKLTVKTNKSAGTIEIDLGEQEGAVKGLKSPIKVEFDYDGVISGKTVATKKAGGGYERVDRAGFSGNGTAWFWVRHLTEFDVVSTTEDLAPQTITLIDGKYGVAPGEFLSVWYEKSTNDVDVLYAESDDSNADISYFGLYSAVGGDISAVDKVYTSTGTITWDSENGVMAIDGVITGATE